MSKKLLVVILAGLLGGAQAETLRFASQGDFLTFDVHSQNETLNTTATGYLYDSLFAYDKNMKVIPWLAESWQRNKENTGWILNIRRGVKFHEGQTLTAKDVAFSLNRALEPSSQFKNNMLGIKKATALDDYTVLVETTSASPLFFRQLIDVRIINYEWAKAHNALHPQNASENEESFMARHANGTGPYKLLSREVDVKTVFVENTDWWNKAYKTGNVDRIEYTPISSNATRTAALLSGEVDLVVDPPTQDIARLERDPNITVRYGSENRVVLITLDQFNDNPQFVKVPGKENVNPFKDKRVRQALYEAIDINAIQRAVMRGKSVPTGTIVAQSINGWTPELAKRYPYNPEHAKQLLAEAGYPDGFSFTIDTPNNRWINDEAITKAVAAMWSKIGLDVSVNAMPRAQFFPKMLSLNCSAYLVAWGINTFDALYGLQSLSQTFDPNTGKGLANLGRMSDARIDELIAQAEVEADEQKRTKMLSDALQIEKENYYHIPLHEQSLTWAMRKNVDARVTPNNRVDVLSITVNLVK